MIPIRDENPTRRPAVVTVSLIVTNCVIFVWQLFQMPQLQEHLAYTFGAVPLLLTRDFNLLPQFPLHWGTLVSSQFLHGDLGHLGGNMLYLWIFGNNVEDYLGRGRFLLFYLVCGVAAALTHVFSDITSSVPMIGASGAISGLLGAYLVLYPHARVVVLVWFLFFVRFVSVPAFIVLGIWFVVQLSGVLGQSGNIAWFAHLGGFLFGIASIKLYRRRPSRPYFV